MSRAVAAYLAAFCAAVDDNVPLFGVGLGANGLKQAAALVGTVTGVDVDVYGPQAKGTVVAGGISQRLYLSAAMRADKSAVVFRKAF